MSDFAIVSTGVCAHGIYSDGADKVINVKLSLAKSRYLGLLADPKLMFIS